MCQDAYHRNAEVFPYLLPEMYSLELCNDCYKRLLKKSSITVSLTTISSAVPKEYHQDKKIFSLERKLEIRRIKSKKYEDGKFIVVEDVRYEQQPVENIFESFAEFYIFVDKDLKDADLLEYDFEGVKLKGIDVSEAYIRADVLLKNDMYSDAYFNINVKTPDESTELVPYEPKEVIAYYDVTDSGLSDDTRRIYYISDLHLNHKLQMQFQDRATVNEVKYYIKQLVSKLVKSGTEHTYDDFLLIEGDVSFNFNIAEIFYTELAQKWEPERIVVILGNHELWDYDSDEKDRSVEKVIEKYRNLFGRLNINFLQNDLMVVTGDFSFCSKVNIITEKELLSNSAEWLREKCLNSRLTIFGGIGFSGENQEFNADYGIYRKTIETLEKDKQYTEAFKTVYDKVKDAIHCMKAVIMTHMPYWDWSNEEPIPNWIYVCGHTHKNQLYMDDKKTLYADNQIGYYVKSMSLKHFRLTIHYDIFSDYQDGIYEISREEYLDFSRGLKVTMTFNRTEGQILMLKRDGIYCFFYRAETGKIYLLKGGSTRKVEHQDIQYFYDTMSVYKKAMEYVMHDYHEALKHISRQIQKIGGSGRIHGSIVDIDDFNHIYLNPGNGQILCYWALAVDYRYEYPNIETLLKAEREDLYLTYQQECLENKNELQIFTQDKLTYDLDAVKVVSDTSMYTPSNMFRSLQYMFDVNVIREWNEELVERAVNKYLGAMKFIDKDN